MAPSPTGASARKRTWQCGPDEGLRRRRVAAGGRRALTGSAADALVDAWERCWSGRDPARFAEVCTHDVHYEDPFTATPLRGPDQIAAHARRLWQAVPDARVNATGPRVANDSFLSAPCRVIGTHAEQVGRIAATGRPVDVHAVVFAELRDGRLYRVRAFFDVFGLARQLGVLPQPGTAGERALLMLRGFGLRG